jgi:dinuclear metal center YbgI/SA1388 family protein
MGIFVEFYHYWRAEMVKLKEIKEFLDSTVPLELQDSWDNSGLQVGWSEKEVKVVGFALSASTEVLKEASEKGVNLLITHHPLTISGVRALIPDSYPSNLFLEAVKREIAVYALHTNLDVSPYGPTAFIAQEIGLEGEPIVEKPPYGIVGQLREETTQRELYKKLVSILPPDAYRVINFNPYRKVKKVAVCSGSGASFIDAVAGMAEVFVTGDVKYHDALKAVELGLTVFDMGHFGTERLFYLPVMKLLSEAFPALDFVVLSEKSPFEVVRDA